MNRCGFILASAVLGTAIIGGAAAAGPFPPGPPAIFATTHAQPVAGVVFTGVTVQPSTGARLYLVRCGPAHVGRQPLRGIVTRFYAAGVHGPATVACSWRIPAGSAGRMLRVSSTVWAFRGARLSRLNGPAAAWRVR